METTSYSANEPMPERGEAMMAGLAQDMMDGALMAYFAENPDDKMRVGVNLTCPDCLREGREDLPRVFVALEHHDGDTVMYELACEGGHSWDLVKRDNP